MNKNTFTVSTWNIMGRSPITSKFDKIMPLLKNNKADFFCLQEAHPDENALKQINIYLPNYHIFNSADTKSKNIFKTGNMIISKYPILNSGYIDLSRFSQNYIFKELYSDKASFVDVQLPYSHKIRIYNCHLRIVGTGINDRISVLKAIIDDSAKISFPSIICGDFNSTIPVIGFARKIIRWYHKQPKNFDFIDNKKEPNSEAHAIASFIKKYNWQHVFPVDTTTWFFPKTKFSLFNLKLDWIFYKQLHLLNKNTFSSRLSDHKLLRAEFEL